MGFIALPLSQGLLLVVLTLTVGYRLWELGKERDYLTPADFFDDRYGSKTLRLMVGFVGAFFTLFYLAMQFVGSSHAISGITGGNVPYLGALLLIAVVTGLYTMLGGMKAVVWTDAAQGIILLGMSIFATVLVVGEFGGVSGIFLKMAEGSPKHLRIPGPDNTYTDMNWMIQFLVLPFGVWFGPQMLVRILAARDKKSIYASSLAIPISQIFLFMIAGPILGFAGFLTFGPGVEAPDQIVPMLMREYVPLAIGSFIMAGAIAAGMSTVDSMILAISQIVTKDFVSQFRYVSPRGAVTIGRIVTILTVSVGFAIALNPPKMLIDIIVGITFTAMSQLAPGFILGLYWRRANRYGIGIGLGAGIAILAVTQVLGVTPLGVPGFLWAFSINWLLALGVPFIWPRYGTLR